MDTIDHKVQPASEMSLKEIINNAKQWVIFLKTKWIYVALAVLLGSFLGLGYALNQKTKYIAILTFALEEEKSAGGGFAGALGLASSLGIDVGGTVGGAFNGANLMELMKSRNLVQKALLQPLEPGNSNQSLADYFIKFTNLNKNWAEDPALNSLHFDPLSDVKTFSITQDSVMEILWKKIIGPNGVLSVSQKDKKVSIITVESKSEDERFSKIFTETIARVVSDFYIETKSKKAKQNFEILQRQTDSVRQELNKAILGVAAANDNTYNLNPAQNIRRSPSAQRQIDVQTNTAVLTQLIPNLEMAKVSLRKETPLIQIIDTPVFPLTKEKPGKLNMMILIGVISGLVTIGVIVLNKLLKEVISKQD